MRDVRLTSRRDTDSTIIESAPSVVFEGPRSAAYALSVRDLLHVIRQRFWLIALGVVFLKGMAVGFILLQIPVYEASI